MVLQNIRPLKISNRLILEISERWIQRQNDNKKIKSATFIKSINCSTLNKRIIFLIFNLIDTVYSVPYCSTGCSLDTSGCSRDSCSLDTPDQCSLPSRCPCRLNCSLSSGFHISFRKLMIIRMFLIQVTYRKWFLTGWGPWWKKCSYPDGVNAR